MIPRFRSLRTRLTVLYAGLFAAAMLLISLAVYTAISDNAIRVVRGELTASGGVFDRIWAMRTAQLENGAGLLSRDFGFREAIATHDNATITSALENLKVRLGIDLAFMIGVDGKVTVAGERQVSGLEPAALKAMQGDDAASGVLVIGHAPYEVVSVPVLAPVPMGWVVFANRLDDSQMTALERLSAIPLDAAVLVRAPDGAWRDDGKPADRVQQQRVSRFVEGALKGESRPGELSTREGPAIALAKSLSSIAGGPPVVLVLKYPIARAMAPYQPLLAMIIGAGLLGVIQLVVGSWGLARSVTRPLSALEEAAHRLQRGEDAKVAITGDDEIARLAEGFNAMAAEIGERERRIIHLALHDADSGLPNRQWLDRHITELIEVPAGEAVVVAALGIDRFAHVRGAIGHGLAGDLVGEIGARLRQRRPDLHVARLSTAVLGVALRAGDLDAARRAVAELQGALDAPVRLGETTIDVSLAAGLAFHALGAERVASVIERANIALDQARDARQTLAVFDAAAYGDPAANLSLMGEMRRSTLDGDLMLHHQPKYDLRRGLVSGVEALVRWRHPTRGLLGPNLFVPMAEETGHIRALTEWVLAQAIADQAVMRQAGHALTVSVNISGRLLGDAEFAEAALEMIAAAEGEICLEITETAVIENPELGLAVIERFAAAGVAISIDDYGTGLSSLAYLKQIRASELKIDKAFVVAIADSQRDALLVRSTVDLAHGLGMKVTAEGVETPTALALLSSMGCDLIQGYFIARPMPLNELLIFMDQEKRTARTYG
jgi:EAL domain-containing protein (putative c-di-GMP-specific phosphodiesterase class I)/GGDEF domain-containing protein